MSARTQDGITYRTGGKTGRNDPCPCRSGRKYKHCCALGREHDPLTEKIHRLTRELADAERDLSDRDSAEYDRKHPTRARAVCAWIDKHLPPDPPAPEPRAQQLADSIRKERRQSGLHRPRRHGGSPSRISRKDKPAARRDPRAWLTAEDAELELGTQEINRLMRKVRKEGQYKGAVSMALACAALYIAPEVQHDTGLNGEEHEAALVEWFVGNWGQFAHNTVADPSAYLEWRYRVGPGGVN